MTAALRKVIEQVRCLTEDERRQLNDLLPSLPGISTTATNEQEFARKLAAEGRLTLPAGSPAPAVPVPIAGQPLSEMIIEERR